jgi:formylglycine-generating enzyme required for sulfatase activity
MSVLVRAFVLAAAGFALLPPGLEQTDTSPNPRFATEGTPGLVSDDGTHGVLTLRAPGASMLFVPKSSFVMGSTGDEVLGALVDCQKEPRGHLCDVKLFADETPIRRVTLSAYYLDRLEVTVADYARCAAVSRCHPLPFAEGARRFDRPNYPASLVTWEEARDYCEYRGARLPTEAEFERAARGASGRRFPWGDLYNSHASNHGRLAWDSTDAGDGFAELAPVGSFPAGKTKEGFLDLAGNVSEWVEDRYAPEYDDADVNDPKGPTTTNGTPARTVRGGGFDSAEPWLRGAARTASEPSARRPSIGFRCARNARPASETE